MPKHISLEMADRTGSASDADGRWVPIAGRVGADNQWTITSDVGYVSSSDVTVKVQVAPTRSNDKVTELYAFALRSAIGQDSVTVTVSGMWQYGYIRTVGTINGSISYGTVLEAPFFSVTANSGVITREMSQWSELQEEARIATEDLLQPYQTAYSYSLQMHKTKFHDDMVQAVGRQLRHRFTQWAISKSLDPKMVQNARSEEAVDRKARLTIAKYAGATYF
jgi:hypothetical protein